MRSDALLYRSGVAVTGSHTIREAAQLMESAGVGSLAVLDGERLVGIVTDRDLVRRGIARGVPTDARIDSVMTTPVATVDADADEEQLVRCFGLYGVRRMPVVDTDGRFLGMLSLDDLLVRLCRQFTELTRPVSGEVLVSHRDAAVPAVVAQPG